MHKYNIYIHKHIDRFFFKRYKKGINHNFYNVACIKTPNALFLNIKIVFPISIIHFLQTTSLASECVTPNTLTTNSISSHAEFMVS